MGSKKEWGYTIIDNLRLQSHLRHTILLFSYITWLLRNYQFHRKVGKLDPISSFNVKNDVN